MILERVELTSKEGQEEAFAKAFADGLHFLTGEGGGKSARFGRGVENPDKFILLVEWDSVDAHKAFIGTPPHQEFGKLIGPHAAGGVVEHFDLG
ncbi:MAG TPA: antibiotic biosynthesis monooxygenase family protein [Sphingobium sp.]|uniref:antibiotic biosynthesis monooxygenase family protein n=1 Tax=Sphingobium sp. TaxID=1912891 RepID=UPI002ED22AA7